VLRHYSRALRVFHADIGCHSVVVASMLERPSSDSACAGSGIRQTIGIYANRLQLIRVSCRWLPEDTAMQTSVAARHSSRARTSVGSGIGGWSLTR